MYQTSRKYYIEVEVDLNSFVTGTQSSDGDNADGDFDDVFGFKGFSIDSSDTVFDASSNEDPQAYLAENYWKFVKY